MTARLVSDKASPMHRADADDLRQAIDATQAALEDTGRASSRVAAAA